MAKTEATKTEVKAEPKKVEPVVVLSPEEIAKKALLKNISLLEKMVTNNETVVISRVFRNNTKVRAALKSSLLLEVVEAYLPAGNDIRNAITGDIAVISVIEGAERMEIESPPPAADQPKSPSKENKTQDAPEITLKVTSTPEVLVYLHWLSLILLLKYKLYEQALISSGKLLAYAVKFNRRTLHPLVAKVYTCYCRVHELTGNLSSLKGELLSAHRTACLHHNDIGQATILNLLLRSYLKDKLYDQASQLISKTTYPEEASNNQYCRYLYYLGKIQAIQLDYSDSFSNLTRALRKAPQNTALGFRIAATKLSIIVQLLTGEVPDRAIFSAVETKEALKPYLEITQAVRVGNLSNFEGLVASSRHSAQFVKDDTYNLILRLRQNVIKTGLKKINISYSKISFADIAAKLKLDSAEVAEYTCAKAIRDGVIEATLNHEKGYLQSKEVADTYSTVEPQAAYHKRIKFCLDVYNEAVKAMRYPEDPYKKNLPLEEDLPEVIDDEEMLGDMDEMD